MVDYFFADKQREKSCWYIRSALSNTIFIVMKAPKIVIRGQGDDSSTTGRTE